MHMLGNAGILGKPHLCSTVLRSAALHVDIDRAISECLKLLEWCGVVCCAAWHSPWASVHLEHGEQLHELHPVAQT